MVPSSASLHLHCVSEDPPTHSEHLILPLISAVLFHHCGTVELKSLKVTAKYMEDLIEVAASISPPKSTSHDQHIIEGDMDSDAQLILSFDGLTTGHGQFVGPSKQAEILGHVFSILPISNLEFLSIVVSETTRSVNWYELFSQCRNITTIHARGWGATSLLQSLAPQKPANAPFCSKAKRGKGREGKRDIKATQARATNHTSGSGPTATTTTTAPFPKLMCLLLENLGFNTPIPYFGILGDVLLNALRWRKMNNLPVKTLTVDRCVIAVSCANSLKKYVQEFSWDGDEGPVVAIVDGICQDYDYTSDFINTRGWLEDFFSGATQAEWEY
jgi:hypothetical protein